ncbi:hypothetical protein GYH30_022194 [Glycine max]|nr:hypothetical protein GYH30_022194 [Glycine max]
MGYFVMRGSVRLGFGVVGGGAQRFDGGGWVVANCTGGYEGQVVWWVLRWCRRRRDWVQAMHDNVGKDCVGVSKGSAHVRGWWRVSVRRLDVTWYPIFIPSK